MTLLDIIVALLLILALWRGFKRGFFVQLAGLAGLFLGAWLAVKWGTGVGLFFGISEKYAATAGFLIVMVLVLLGMAGIGRIFKKIFGFAGLGILDKVAGMVLSAAKTGLILGLLFWGFDSINRSRQWVPESKLSRSVLYRPLVESTVAVFPYIKKVDDVLAPLYRGLPSTIGPDPTQEEPHGPSGSEELPQNG